MALLIMAQKVGPNIVTVGLGNERAKEADNEGKTELMTRETHKWALLVVLGTSDGQQKHH